MMRAGILLLLCACGGASVGPPGAGPEYAPSATACEVPPMDQLYAGDFPPNPYAAATPAAPCMTQPHDAVIVLGCPSNADGSASDCQVRRADIAVRLNAPSFIVSGAAAHNAFVEADALAALLTARGIAAGRIFREPRAMHTDENIYWSSRIMQKQGWQSALVVSDPGHLIFTALCDSNCCVNLGRLTVVELPDGTKVGHYVLYPEASTVLPAECAQIELPDKFMCTNRAQRLACADDFQLRP
ncbi:MAG: YdcF family protein [Myxococcales bacterium]